jgi:hypothetical protein
VLGFMVAVVGSDMVPFGSIGCGREEMTCGWAVLEEGGEGPHGVGWRRAMGVEVRGEEGIDRGDGGVLVGE